MKRYKVTVTKTKDFVIEIDEKIYNEDEIKNFEEYFGQLPKMVDKLKSIARIYALYRAECKGSEFIDGFGYVLEQGEIPFGADIYDVDHGINLIEFDDDGDIEAEIEEIVN